MDLEEFWYDMVCSVVTSLCDAKNFGKYKKILRTPAGTSVQLRI